MTEASRSLGELRAKAICQVHDLWFRATQALDLDDLMGADRIDVLYEHEQPLEHLDSGPVRKAWRAYSTPTTRRRLRCFD